jgi:hypothetical protein
VTGVQTCALPISPVGADEDATPGDQPQTGLLLVVHGAAAADFGKVAVDICVGLAATNHVPDVIYCECE